MWKRVCHSVFYRKRKLLLYTLLLLFLSLTVWTGYSFKSQRLYIRKLRSTVNCTKLILNDNDEMQLANKTLSTHQSDMTPDDSFVELAKDCAVFKHSRGYIMHPMSEEERHFPIAYSILVYHFVDQFESLLRAIYMPQNVYCIHVDRKANDNVHVGIQAIVKCFPNVFIASKLESVVYASYSRLKADLNCAEDLVKRDPPWRYLINLSGEMYPLKTNNEIVKILKMYNGSNDIIGFRGDLISDQDYKWKSKFQVQATNPFLSRFSEHLASRKIVKVNDTNEPAPHNIEIMKGSAYNVFSRGCIDYVLHDPVVQDLLRWSESIYSPDEVIWATIQFLKYNPMLKTPGGFTGDIESNVWSAAHVQWVDDTSCRGLSLRGICIPDFRDLPELVSRRELFVNKLLPFEHDPIVLRCLEENLRKRTILPRPFDVSQYQKPMK